MSDGYTPAVHALKRLHAEIGGKIKDNKNEARQLVESMKHIEAVLKMLQPDFNLRAISAKRKYRPDSPYKRGTVFRTVLVAMREADRPLTSREISEMLLLKAGVTKPTAKQLSDIYGSVHSSLRNHQGKTIERVGDGIPARWKIVG